MAWLAQAFYVVDFILRILAARNNPVNCGPESMKVVLLADHPWSRLYPLPEPTPPKLARNRHDPREARVFNLSSSWTALYTVDLCRSP